MVWLFWSGIGSCDWDARSFPLFLPKISSPFKNILTVICHLLYSSLFLPHLLHSLSRYGGLSPIFLLLS